MVVSGEIQRILAAGENRFNVELENGITHWGVTAEQVQEMKA